MCINNYYICCHTVKNIQQILQVNTLSVSVHVLIPKLTNFNPRLGRQNWHLEKLDSPPRVIFIQWKFFNFPKVSRYIHLFIRS
jgi:hypothetical protein